MEPFVCVELDLEIPPKFNKYFEKYSHRNGWTSFDKLIENNFEDSKKQTVAYKEKNIVDEKIRSGLVINEIQIRLEPNLRFNFCKDIVKILPNIFRGFDPIEILSMDAYWELMIYNKNDKFTRHTDGKKHEGHFGTLLLFPPSSINQFTGGELVFYQSGKVLKTLSPQTFTQWTLVAFPINVEHECLPIVSGTRYVFKSQFVLPSSYIDLCNITEDALPLVIDSSSVKQDILKCEEEIADYQEKIKNLLATIDNLKKFEPTPNIKRILKEVNESSSNNVVIILDKAYDLLNPEFLVGEDRILYNEIIKEYPRTILSFWSGKIVFSIMKLSKNIPEQQ